MVIFATIKVGYCVTSVIEDIKPPEVSKDAEAKGLKVLCFKQVGN
jgi:hypothetical protein